MTWRSVPLLRVALALCLGIVIARYAPSTPLWAPASLAAGFALGLAVPIALAHRGTVRGTLVLGILAAFGCMHMLQRQEGLSAKPLPEGAFFTARLLGTPSGQGAWLGADAEVIEVYRDSVEAIPRLKIRLMFARDAVEGFGESPVATASPSAVDTAVGTSVRASADTAPTPGAPGTASAEPAGRRPSLGPGSLIVASASIDMPTPPRNPHAFNYAAFLARRGVHHQAWLRASDFTVLRGPSGLGPVDRLRDYLSGRIDAAYPTQREAGVARALLLGDRSEIDESTRLSYSATGAIHALSVSGLHTGVIAGVVVFVLNFLFGSRWPWVRFAMLAAALSGYCVLTGMSPSVLRSALMFSIVFAGVILQRDANGLNNLGLAATLTLAFAPQLLFEIGFQLSYLAVAGIFLFYTPLQRAWGARHAWVKKLTGLINVSLAATLGTFPVTIFNFHQFPVYFALSSLAVVPLVGFALCALLGELFVDGLLHACGLDWPWVMTASWAAIWLCNALLAVMAQLPGVLVEGLWPSAPAAALLLLSVALAGVLVNRKRRSLAFAAVTVWVIAGLAAGYDTYLKRSHAEAIVYSVPSGTPIDLLLDGTLATALADSVSEIDRNRQILPHRSALGHTHPANTIEALRSDERGARWYVHRGLRFAYLGAGDPALAAGAPEVDWVVVEDASQLSAAEIASAFPTADLVLRRNPPPWLRAEWDSLGPRLHLLHDDGAYVVPLRD